MPDAFIYDALRTPRGRGRPDGCLHSMALSVAWEQVPLRISESVSAAL